MHERSEKGPVRIAHSHMVKELRKVQSWRNASRTVTSDYASWDAIGLSRGVLPVEAYVLFHTRVAGEAMYALGLRR